jgi:hypothetical protein
MEKEQAAWFEALYLVFSLFQCTMHQLEDEEEHAKKTSFLFE